MLHNSATLFQARLQDIFQVALTQLVDGGLIPAPTLSPEFEPPRDPSHGDIMTNFALVSAKELGKNPRQLAEMIVQAIGTVVEIESISVAGPGFINLTLSPQWVSGFVGSILNQGEDFGKSRSDTPQKINVEFVSVNPNGPITIGSGRGAAYGSALCNVLEAAGHTVSREYYINDGVNSEQMRLFAESVRAIAEGLPFPEEGYKGDYVEAVANSLDSKPADIREYQELAQTKMLQKQKADLAAFQTTFDTWFSEQSLHDSGRVITEIDRLVSIGSADTEPKRVKLTQGKGGVIKDVEVEGQEGDNVLWLRSTKFGDDQDRVLRRGDGRLTYIASDAAYHRDKFNRPPDADKLITVLGPDHHGYIARLTAVVAATLMDQVVPGSTGSEFSDIDRTIYKSAQEKSTCQEATRLAKEKLQVQIFQIVKFMKDGKPAPMRKRDGNIYALIDLIDEIGQKVLPNGSVEEQKQAGSDVARFFYLMRHHDTAMDFDLELATRQSDENPVFYVQYAHARICSVIDKAAESGLVYEGNANLYLLTNPAEKGLIMKILSLPDTVAMCALDYSVNRLANFAQELAREYHAFYDQCRVIQLDDVELSVARLALCQATKLAIRNCLALLGISAPERLNRAEETPAPIA